MGSTNLFKKGKIILVTVKPKDSVKHSNSLWGELGETGRAWRRERWAGREEEEKREGEEKKGTQGDSKTA